jgi:hypothetical protein
MSLKVKTVVADATSNLWHTEDESVRHIIFSCPFSRSFWSALCFHLPAGQTVHELHHLPRPPAIPPAHYSSFVLLCCWQLGKRRNHFVFRQEMISMRHLLRLCKEDAQLWSHRLPRSQRAVAQLWCNLLSSAM